MEPVVLHADNDSVRATSEAPDCGVVNIRKNPEICLCLQVDFVIDLLTAVLVPIDRQSRHIDRRYSIIDWIEFVMRGI